MLVSLSILRYERTRIRHVFVNYFLYFVLPSFLNLELQIRIIFLSTIELKENLEGILT